MMVANVSVGQVIEGNGNESFDLVIVDELQTYAWKPACLCVNRPYHG